MPGMKKFTIELKVDCIECHMPKVTKSAVGDPERFTGDIRTHLMAIDPDQVEQFIETDDGLISALTIVTEFCLPPLSQSGRSWTRSNG